MKKLSFIVSLIIFGQLAFGQAVHDRNVIPVAVNLNQVLRMTITNGGNIEFVFNSIDDYKLGLSADQATAQNVQDPEAANSANPVGSTGPGSSGYEGYLPSDAGYNQNFYSTNFSISSSTRWLIEWGAEEADFIGTDNPTQTLDLNNVGFQLVNLGTHDFEVSGVGAEVKNTTADAELYSAGTDQTESVCALLAYPAADPLIEDNDDADQANAGDITENSFELLWRCGTTEAGQDNGGAVAVGPNPMNALSLLNQGNIRPDRYVANVVFELATDF